MVTNLTANLVIYFLLLISKVHADVINDWQYRKAKMVTKSKMYVKYGHASFFGFDLKLMHDWEAVGFRICLAPKNHYSVSAQSYDFCPCLRKLDILDFTLCHSCTDTKNPLKRVMCQKSGVTRHKPIPQYGRR